MSSPGNTAGIVHPGMEIPWFIPGFDRPTVFSAEDMNRMVALLRAYANPELRYGQTDELFLTDGNFVIQLKKRASSSTNSGVSTGMFPFKVLNAEPLGNPATDWLRFQCRAGAAFLYSLEPTVATGTDGVADPDSSTRTATNVFTVASGEDAHYVWASIVYSSGWTVEVENGTTLPANDGTHWPIATIDCSDTTNKIGVVRQWQRSDIILPGRFSVCGPNGQEWWVMPGARES